MKKAIILILLICIAYNVNSQIFRGAVDNEIYINTNWYYDPDWGVEHYGLFYSSNNGQSLELKYDYSFSPFCINPLDVVFSDPLPGYLYNSPVGSSKLMISYNYGETWQVIDSISQFNMVGGCISGQVFKFGFTSTGLLMRSDDFAQTFDSINVGIIGRVVVGASPGVLYVYGLNNDVFNSYFLDISFDNGNSFSEHLLLDTAITGNVLKGIYPGANSGELFLASSWPYYPKNFYKIFFSTDNGYSWELRHSTEPDTNIDESWYYNFSSVRENGSFYITRSIIDETLLHANITIDYSSDTAHTFTRYFHELTPYVGISLFNINYQSSLIEGYPNPANNFLVIELNELINDPFTQYIIRVYNLNGQIADEFMFNSLPGEIRICTSLYPPGIYFGYVFNETGIVAIIKFIVNH